MKHYSVNSLTVRLIHVCGRGLMPEKWDTADSSFKSVTAHRWQLIDVRPPGSFSLSRWVQVDGGTASKYNNSHTKQVHKWKQSKFTLCVTATLFPLRYRNKTEQVHCSTDTVHCTDTKHRQQKTQTTNCGYTFNLLNLHYGADRPSSPPMLLSSHIRTESLL